MPVKRDRDGRRYVQAEVEVPGLPEQVWQAIASGKGVSSWFVPTTIEEREGGATVSSFGPGMDAGATITEWKPPHRYTAVSAGEPGAGGPGTVATEWIVEPRAGGTCIVRVVHRWFADSDDWDGQFEGHAYGWARSFFRILRLFLTHFPDKSCSAFDLAAFSQRSGPETWRVIASALPIDQATGRAGAAPGVPELSGVVEDLEIPDPELLRVKETSPMVKAALEGMEGEDPELLLRLERPAPGFAHLFIMPMGEVTMVSMRVFLYGEEGAAAVEPAKAEWAAWLAERFPADATSD